MHKLNNKINNPKVTLADESRAGVKELYSLGGSILSMHLEQMDLVSLQRQVIISRAEKQENFASI